MLKKVALPAGAVGLGVAAASKAFGSSSKTKSGGSSLNTLVMSQLFPLLLNLIQGYFLKEQKQKMEKIDHELEDEVNPSPRPEQLIHEPTI